MMITTDYINSALRTKSNSLHTDIMPIRVVLDSLVRFECAAAAIDMQKKALFYGKQPNTFNLQRQIDEKRGNAEALGVFVQQDPLHAIMGMITEVAELSEVVRAEMAGFDVGSKLVDELGDQMWYLALLCYHYKLDPEKVMEANIAKLKARFPEKFSEELAVNRNLETEKESLESVAAA